jgi:hypothetical protein
MEQKQGLCLKAPHAKLIFENKKKVIVKCKLYRNAIRQTYYVVQDNMAYGVILIKSAAPINLDEFEKNKELHLVSDEERLQWWPNKETLFAYYFDVVEKFPEPKKIKLNNQSASFSTVEFLKEIVCSENFIGSKDVFKKFSNPNEAAEFVFTKSHKFAIEKMFDGVSGILFKRGEECKLFYEDGKDISDKVPKIIEQAKKLCSENFIADGKLVLYDRNLSLGKERLEKFLFRDTEGLKEEFNLKFHLFDIPFLREDLRVLSWHERKSKLHSFDYTENIKEVPSIVVDTKEDAVKAINFLQSLPNSEGAIIKLYVSQYPKNSKISDWTECKCQEEEG